MSSTLAALRPSSRLHLGPRCPALGISHRRWVSFFLCLLYIFLSYGACAWVTFPRNARPFFGSYVAYIVWWLNRTNPLNSACGLAAGVSGISLVVLCPPTKPSDFSVSGDCHTPYAKPTDTPVDISRSDAATTPIDVRTHPPLSPIPHTVTMGTPTANSESVVYI